MALGEYYLYNRGNNRQAIFFERENYLYFLKQFRYFVAQEPADAVAYCLMLNHYHVSKQIQPLSTAHPGQLLGSTLRYKLGEPQVEVARAGKAAC